MHRTSSGKKKVAIIGGGYSAMAAAFELSHRSNPQRDQYEITVYTPGWRLGGKAASARRKMAGRGGSAHNSIIEERDAYLWFGFFENAFHMIRELYEEWTGDPDAWRDVFDTATIAAVPLSAPDKKLRLCKYDLPPEPGLPGERRPKSLAGHVTKFWKFWRTCLQALGELPSEELRYGRQPLLGDRIESLLSSLALTWPGSLAVSIQTLESAATFSSRCRPLIPTGVADLPRALAGKLRAQLTPSFQGEEQRARLWELIDLAFAVLRGLIPTNLQGLRSLDDIDCVEWLIRNGASAESANNPWMAAMYSVVMGYKDGDLNDRQMAAGAAVYGFLLSAMYSGDYLWQLARGSGEDFFVPMYQVLKRRGVHFRFFHRLKKLRLTADRADPRVNQLEFDVQADADHSEYAPLIDQQFRPIRESKFEKGRIACWPAVPDWRQLRNGDAVKAAIWDWAEVHGYATPGDRSDLSDPPCDALEAHHGRLPTDRPQAYRLGEDFDIVVLGTGLGPARDICQDIAARDSRWRDMFAYCTSLPTQSFRLWLNAPMKDLGLAGPPITLAGWQADFQIFVDQRHRIYSERWDEYDRSGHKPARAVCYFRGLLGATEPDERKRGTEQVKANASAFMNAKLKELLPDSVDRSGKFRDHLISAESYTNNSDPAFQVAQSLPGTIKYRIKPTDPSYPNLRICGDWTDCGYNSPSVETAVISGRLAAQSISGWPEQDRIAGMGWFDDLLLNGIDVINRR